MVGKRALRFGIMFEIVLPAYPPYETVPSVYTIILAMLATRLVVIMPMMVRLGH